MSPFFLALLISLPVSPLLSPKEARCGQLERGGYGKKVRVKIGQGERVARALVDGFVYHILNRGNGWQEVFHKDQDYDLFAVLRYVEANPVRAGLVSSTKEWLWSSHKETSGEKSRLLIDEIPVGLPKGWGRCVGMNL